MGSAEIVAGEMRLWSDRGNERRPPAGGAVLADLVNTVVAAASGRRIAVIGPHDDAVVRGLPADSELTLVVRSLDDAEHLARDFPSARVVCGDLRAWASDGDRYDVVVALDGVERLASNDSATPGRLELLGALAAMVVADGLLLVAGDNPLSLLSLADRRPITERRDAGDWTPPSTSDRASWRSRGDWVSALTELGFATSDYAALWSPARPQMLLTSQAATDARIRAAVRRDVRALSSFELHFDPGTTATERISAGQVYEIATAWVAVASRSGHVPELPAGLLEGPDGTVHLIDGSQQGTLLSEEAVRLAQREETAELRDLVSSYLTAVVASEKVAVPDDALLDAGGEPCPLGIADLPAGVDPACHAAAWLGDRLLADDVPLIWPPWMGASAIALSFLAAAGLERTREAVDDAVARVQAGRVKLLDAGGLVAVNERLEREVESVKGQVIAHERLATHRERSLAKERNQRGNLERQVARLEEELAQAQAPSTMRRARNKAGRVVRRVQSQFRDE